MFCFVFLSMFYVLLLKRLVNPRVSFSLAGGLRLFARSHRFGKVFVAVEGGLTAKWL